MGAFTMTTAQKLDSATKPFLTRHAVERIAGEDIPGQYCAKRRMWMVDLGDEMHPLIDVAGSLAELQTKTKVEVETDDTTDIATLPFVTKTDVSNERDDDTQWASSCLALLTKTEVRTEEDKVDLDGFGMALLETSTKTLVRVEEDRQDMGEWATALLETQTKTAVRTEQDDTARGSDFASLHP